MLSATRPLCAFDCKLLFAVVRTYTHMFFIFPSFRAHTPRVRHSQRDGGVASGWTEVVRVSHTLALTGIIMMIASQPPSAAATPATLSCHPSPLTSWQHARIKINRACLACRFASLQLLRAKCPLPHCHCSSIQK
jgi:hypothetical protein